jgi:hypothetical protein
MEWSIAGYDIFESDFRKAGVRLKNKNSIHGSLIETGLHLIRLFKDIINVVTRYFKFSPPPPHVCYA